MSENYYANQLGVRISPHDVAIAGRHGWVVSDPNLTEDTADFIIYLSPVAAKQLSGALNQSIITYEKLHGVIQTEPNQEHLKELAEHPAPRMKILTSETE